MIGEEARNSSLLIRGNREEVAKSSSAENNLLTSTLRIGDGVSGVDLSCADSGDEWTGDGESGAEDGTAVVGAT